MDEKQCVELLEHHGVKATANRIVVVKALAAADRPMSLSELEYQILTIDKSGVFRALTLFKEHHLVHVIEDALLLRTVPSDLLPGRHQNTASTVV